jgi:hypothetical protein
VEVAKRMHEWVIGFFINRYAFGLLRPSPINRFATSYHTLKRGMQTEASSSIPFVFTGLPCG